MTEKQKISREEMGTIDKRRVVVTVVFLAILLGVGGLWAKNNLPRFLAQQEQKIAERSEEAGQVAGETDINFDGLKEQIDEIKKDVGKIKVEDVKEQEAVKKILTDLDALAKKASESAKVLDVKGNLCEEAKRRFCE